MSALSQPQDEKISDKAFLKSLILSIANIVLCLGALCSVTYAWFVGEIASDENTLVSGSFNVVVSVTAERPDGMTVTVEAVKNPRTGVWYCDLPADAEGQPTTYTVTLTLTEDATVKGRGIVKIGDGDVLHTAPIIGANTAGAEGAELTDPFVFTVTVTESTSVRIEPCWGVAVHPDIPYNGSIVVNGESVEEAPTEESSAEESPEADEPADDLPS